MPSTETLTSLALLKVRIDAGGDYLEYLRPFILQRVVLGAVTLVTWINGTTARKIHRGIERRVFTWLLMRESKELGIKLPADL
jgi:hypothetical protein